MGADKVPNWECSFMHREKGLFLSVYVDDPRKIGGKKDNMKAMWDKLMKHVDLGEPSSLLDQHIL